MHEWRGAFIWDVNLRFYFMFCAGFKTRDHAVFVDTEDVRRRAEAVDERGRSRNMCAIRDKIDVIIWAVALHSTHSRIEKQALQPTEYQKHRLHPAEQPAQSIQSNTHKVN